MRSLARQHTLTITGLLSVAALSVVFGTVGGFVPAAWIPRGPDWLITTIPHLNAALSTFALAGIVTGVRAIRRGDVTSHRRRLGP